MVEYARRIEHVRRALEYTGGTHTEYDIAAGIEVGQYQMWCGPDSIVITELGTYPQAVKDCHIFLAGGHLGELEQILTRIETWARGQGCTRVTLAGRKGWLHSFLRERNYEPRWVVMAKELRDEQGKQADNGSEDREQNS